MILPGIRLTSPKNSATNFDLGLLYKSPGLPICINSPSFITTILSDINIASTASWVTIIAVVPEIFKRWRTSSLTISQNLISNLTNGSSSNSILGDGAIARAKATLCC